MLLDAGRTWHLAPRFGLGESRTAQTLVLRIRFSIRSPRPGGAQVTFKIELSGLSRDFGEHAIEHSCRPRARFLGMKRTFYLQCSHAAGLEVYVEVLPGTFTVVGRTRRNRASAPFVVSMV